LVNVRSFSLSILMALLRLVPENIDAAGRSQLHALTRERPREEPPDRDTEVMRDWFQRSPEIGLKEI
jgi:hypothetical protein